MTESSTGGRRHRRGRDRSRPRPVAGRERRRSAAGASTSERILDAALASFATRGYEATSLDALAAGLDIRKQTILYWFPSKEVLLEAVIDRSAVELSAALEDVAGHGRQRAGRGSRPWSARSSGWPPGARSCSAWSARWAGSAPRPPPGWSSALEPLVARASEFLEAEMDAGHMRRHEPRLLLLAIYSTVIGMVTEVEVLRAFGEEPTARSLVRRRTEILELLRSALVDRPGPERRGQSAAWAAFRSRRDGFGAGGGGRFRRVALVRLGPTGPFVFERRTLRLGRRRLAPSRCGRAWRRVPERALRLGRPHVPAAEASFWILYER